MGARGIAPGNCFGRCPIQGRLLALSGDFYWYSPDLYRFDRKDPLKLRLNGAPEFLPGPPAGVASPKDDFGNPSVWVRGRNNQTSFFLFVTSRSLPVQTSGLRSYRPDLYQPRHRVPHSRPSFGLEWGFRSYSPDLYQFDRKDPLKLRLNGTPEFLTRATPPMVLKFNPLGVGSNSNLTEQNVDGCQVVIEHPA